MEHSLLIAQHSGGSSEPYVPPTGGGGGPVDPPPSTDSLVYDPEERGWLYEGRIYPDVSGAGLLIPGQAVPGGTFPTEGWTIIDAIAPTYQAVLDAITVARNQGNSIVQCMPGIHPDMRPITIEGPVTGLVIRGAQVGRTVFRYENVQTFTSSLIRFQGFTPSPRQFLNQSTPRWGRKLYIPSAQLTQHAQFYAPGRFIMLFSNVHLPEHDEKYNTYFTRNDQRYHQQIGQIAAVNAAEGWIELTEPIPKPLNHLVVNLVHPVVPCINCGVEGGITFDCALTPSQPPFIHCIDFYRCWNVWADDVVSINPPNYTVQVAQSGHPEIRNMYQGRNPVGNFSAYFYFGLLAVNQGWLHDSEAERARHGPLIQDMTFGSAVSECVVAGDPHWGHTAFPENNIMSNVVCSKLNNFQAHWAKFGPWLDDNDHSPNGRRNAVIDCDMLEFPNSSGGRGLWLGAGEETTLKRVRMLSGLYHNNAQNALVEVTDGCIDALIEDCELIYDERKTWFPGRQVGVSFHPGVAYNQTVGGVTYPVIQTGLRSGWPDLQFHYFNSKPQIPMIATTSTLTLRRVNFHGISEAQLFRGALGKTPDVIDQVQALPFNVNFIPARPAKPEGPDWDMVIAQKQKRAELVAAGFDFWA